MSYITNPKISLDYEILEKYEAGIELVGTEVKSVRSKHSSLEGAYIIVRGGEAFIQNCYIPAYQEKNTEPGFDPYRNRRLILNKKEIASLASTATASGSGKNKSSKGLTIVPISMYNKGRVIKVEIALVRGKKKHDKRASLRKKAVDRDLERELS